MLREMTGYKEHIMERCDTASKAIRRGAYKDEILSAAVQFSFEITFLILDRLPNNWKSRRAQYVPRL
jgi:hypothetical protein